jgi:hypothetical protein
LAALIFDRTQGLELTISEIRQGVSSNKARPTFRKFAREKLLKEVSPAGCKARAAERERARRCCYLSEGLTEAMVDSFRRMEALRVNEGEEPDWFAEHRVQLRVCIRAMEHTLARQQVAFFCSLLHRIPPPPLRYLKPYLLYGPSKQA